MNLLMREIQVLGPLELEIGLSNKGGALEMLERGHRKGKLCPKFWIEGAYRRF